MSKYHLEFILYVQDPSLDILKNSIIEFGEGLEILELLEDRPQEEERKGKSFKVSLSTEDPTIIFDTCAQFGKIKSVKVDEHK
ncbi:MAG: hypothetical protein ABIA66_04040 [Candidatus Omnitrophota bacterium]